MNQRCSCRLAPAVALLVAASLCASARAAAPPPPPGGAPVIPADVAAFGFGGRAAGDGSAEVVAVDGQPFKQAVRVRTARKPELTYDVQLTTPTVAAVAKGDVLLATLWARRVETRQETGEAFTEFVFEKNGPPHAKSAEFGIGVGPQWQQFQVPFVALDDYPAGGAQVCLRAGYAPQTIEIGGVEVVNYGKAVALRDLPRTAIAYPGMEPDAAWRKAADERIERHRKGDLTVTVVDAAGKPVAGAKVAVAQKRHAFGFGTAVVAKWLTDDSPDGRRYREVLEANFNKVVFENDLKWGPWELGKDAPPTAYFSRKNTLAAIDWLRERKFGIRGHVLVWPGWDNLPERIRQLKDDPPALRKAVEDHIRDELGVLTGKLDEFDVINETQANHDLLDLLGRDVMVDWFRVAHETDPNLKLYYNDYTMLSGGAVDEARIDHYHDTARFLTDRRAVLHGLGEQGHFGNRPTPPERMLQILDRFAAFGLPIQITEFDIDSTDEQYQAQYTRDFLTAAFSHPSVNGVIMWGFWEGAHWKPEAAPYRKDWSPRPHAEAWIDLMTKRWWTNAEATTGAAGAAVVRGFLGEYEVTATVGDRTKTVKASLTKDGAAARVQLP